MALQLITKCFNELKTSKYDSIFSLTKFIVKRDEAILKEYIKNILKINRQWHTCKNVCHRFTH